MSWLFFGLICALAESLKDLFSRKSLENVNSLTLSWVFVALTLLFSSPLLLLEETPSLGPDFWTALLAHGLLYGLSIIIYMRALELSDISLSVPLVMFTPLFMLLTGPLIIGEYPSIGGIIGVLLIVFGSYLLNFSSLKSGLFEPWRALLSQSGPRWMLLVAFIWSFTSVIDKIGIKNSAPIFWGVTLHAFIFLWFTALALLKGQLNLKTLKSSWKKLMLVGVFNTIQMASYVLAMSLGYAVYVLSLKRTSVLLVILFGHFFFGEKKVRERLLGAIVMVGGVVVISWVAG